MIWGKNQSLWAGQACLGDIEGLSQDHGILMAPSMTSAFGAKEEVEHTVRIWIADSAGIEKVQSCLVAEWSSIHAMILIVSYSNGKSIGHTIRKSNVQYFDPQLYLIDSHY